jgi:hypothetical protein
MIIKSFPEMYPNGASCTRCRKSADIMINCYCKGMMHLCQFCAKQLARILLEDLCDLAGDRHG